MRFLFYACKDTTKYRETSPFRPIFIRKRLQLTINDTCQTTLEFSASFLLSHKQD